MGDNFKDYKILIIACLVLILVFVGITYFLMKDKLEEPGHGPCLADDEVVDYPLDERYAQEIKMPKIPVRISVRDKNTRQERFNFQINNIPLGYSQALELHTCGVYVIRMFNYDSKKTKQDPGFRAELWKYKYNGEANQLLILAEKDKSGVYKSYYSYNFNIDLHERYLVLLKSHLGQDDYALVMKDLNTLEDLFVLKLKDILIQNPNVIPGNFDLGLWIENGKYLCGDLYQGALDTAYYRIETNTWEVDISPPPPDLLAGVERAVNYHKLYLAYVDIPTFTGFQEVYEQIIETARKEGKQKNLFVYNLVTKETIKIASADPEWQYEPKWISDTELEYYLPSGERKVYNVKDK